MNTHIITGKRAVLYLRYSSNSQTEQSIEGQRRVCSEFAEREGYTVIREYVDRATSASHDTQKRLSFLKMIDDSEYQDFDAVIVYKLDRFARDRYDSAIYKKKLKTNNVRVVSATEGLTDSPESIMLESVLEGMAEYYSRELSQKVSRGIRESIEKRQFLGGPVPFGFYVKDKKLLPDKNTRATVQEMYELIVDGYSVAEVTRRLEQKGIRDTKGKPFSRATVHRMLQNKRYIGYYVYGDVEIPNVTEALIDEELFYKAQERLKKRRFNKMAKTHFMLSGKLFCGECGEPMTGESGTSSTGTVYHYYKCYGKRKSNGCTKANLKKDDIEQLVINKCREQLTDENINLIAETVMDAYSEYEPVSDLDRLESDLENVKREIQNYVLLIGKGIMSDAVINQLQESEQRKAQLEREIEIEKEKSKELTFEMIAFWLEKIRDETVNQDQMLIDLFVKRVDVFDDPDSKERKAVIRLSVCGQSESSETVSFGSPFEIDTNVLIDIESLTILFVMDLPKR